MSIWRYYTTLANAKGELKATTTKDDAYLQRLIQVVSTRVDGIMSVSRVRPYFAPYIETRSLPITPRKINSYSNLFSLKPFRLLALDTVTLLDADNSQSITDITELYRTFTPTIDYLRITDQGTSWYQRLAYCRPPYRVEVRGTWGYNTDYANAWEAITTITADVLNTTDTTITVDSASAISPGALLRINDEFMGVTAVSGVTVSVKRGVNGSTAATHASGASVDVYAVDFRIDHEVARQVGLLYSRRGAYSVETLDGVGVVTYPRDLLASLRVTLTEVMYG